MSNLPNHEAATAFADDVVDDENPDVRNLARAYIEAVLALRESEGALNEIRNGMVRVAGAPVSVADYLNLSTEPKRKRRKRR